MGTISQDVVREAGLGAHDFIRSVGGMLWGSQAKSRLVDPNQEEQDFGELHRGLT